MRRKKASAVDNIPVDILKKLGDSGLQIMTPLVNMIYMSADWTKDFIYVTIIA